MISKAPEPGFTYRLVHSTAVECLHGSISSTGVIVLDEAVVEALGLWREISPSIFLYTSEVHATRLTFLSGMILTLWTWPVVSKIWRKTSSVTRWSSPPTYSARLLGSGAARRAAVAGERIPPAPGEVTEDGMGLVFVLICSGGGWVGTDCWPFLPASKPGAPAPAGGGGIWDAFGAPLSAMTKAV